MSTTTENARRWAVAEPSRYECVDGRIEAQSKMIIVQRRLPSTPMFLIQPEGERGIDGRLDNVD
jgi:hypothetical protein